MSATFHVTTMFALQERTLLVLVGRILSGELRAGMATQIEAKSGSRLSMTVTAITPIRSTTERDQVALLFSYGSEDELQTWRDAISLGDTLEFVE